MLCPRNYIALPKGKKVSWLAPNTIFISHMTKSGASQKIVPLHTQEPSSTTAPIRTTKIGTNLVDYPYEFTTQTANMVSVKIMWKSVISTPGAKFGGADIKNMYLETPLDWYEYMQMPLKLFPDDIINHYNLCEKAFNGYVYMEI
jgi:hypothetical protein